MPDIKRPVVFCGENPAITLYAPHSERVVAAASYWHCTYSAHGSGHASDGAQRYADSCTTAQASLRLEWSEPLDHKQICSPQFPAGPQAFDLTTVICPCRHATIVLNGALLPGQVQTSQANGWPASSAFLPFAESWIGPVATYTADG